MWCEETQGVLEGECRFLVTMRGSEDLREHSETADGRTLLPTRVVVFFVLNAERICELLSLSCQLLVKSLHRSLD